MLAPALALGQDASELRRAVAKIVTAHLSLPSPPLTGRPSPRKPTVPLFQPRAVSGTLTGTEGITRQTYRDAIADGGQLDAADFTELQELLDELETTIGVIGWESTSFEAVKQSLTSLELERNWARAVVLGEAAEAERLTTEIEDFYERWRENNGGLVADPVTGSYHPGWDSDVIRVTAIFQKQSLNVAANQLRLEAAYLTDGLDPQGYVRQRLNFEAERALILADFMLDVGEASAIIESL